MMLWKVNTYSVLTMWQVRIFTVPQDAWTTIISILQMKKLRLREDRKLNQGQSDKGVELFDLRAWVLSHLGLPSYWGCKPQVIVLYKKSTAQIAVLVLRSFC